MAWEVQLTGHIGGRHQKPNPPSKHPTGCDDAVPGHQLPKACSMPNACEVAHNQAVYQNGFQGGHPLPFRVQLDQLKRKPRLCPYFGKVTNSGANLVSIPISTQSKQCETSA